MTKHKMTRRVNSFFNNFNTRRLITDEVLGMTGTSLSTENEICNLFGKENYFKATKEERKIISKMYYWILGREMQVIYLSMKYLKNLQKEKKLLKFKNNRKFKEV